MTKQEIIQQAYGESYSYLKQFINYADGSCEVFSISHGKTNGAEPNNHGFKDVDFSIIHYGGAGYFWLPNLLIGLETNNGWTKIESGDDLPKVSGTRYKVILADGSMEEMDINYSLREVFNLWKITHYKEIKQDLPPLY